MLTIREQEGDRLTIEARDRLSRRDYVAFVPAVERQIERAGRLRVLVRLIGFRGFRPSGLLEELRFDLRHRRDLSKVAVVGEKRWQAMGVRLVAPFFEGEVRFFEDERDARAWLA